MGTRSTLRLHTGNRIPAFGLGTLELTERTADTVVVSNHSMEQIKALVAATGETPVVGQVVEPVRLQPGNAGGVPQTEQRHPGVQPVDARDASRRSRARIHRRAVRQDAGAALL